MATLLPITTLLLVDHLLEIFADESMRKTMLLSSASGRVVSPCTIVIYMYLLCLFYRHISMQLVFAFIRWSSCQLGDAVSLINIVQWLHLVLWE